MRSRSHIYILTLVCFASINFGCTSNEATHNNRPNILWISVEDISPHLGAYGDEFAVASNTSPNLDAFATQSLTFTKVSSNAPVCAVGRTTLISGMYAPSMAVQHMRSRIPAPEWLEFFPRYLQQAGYYTTNNAKQDYNLEKPAGMRGWHESSPTAHWQNAPEGTPFFAVFNFLGTHESQIRNENDNPVHEPASVILPPYHPDIPEVREDWAQYYDRIRLADDFFAQHVNELKEAGLDDETIIFFWGDHGSGMPRSKRFAGWSGLHVPLIVHVPEKYESLAPAQYEPGAMSDQLISFVDFAPTILSIAGIEAPSYYQGRAFMGSLPAEPSEYLYGFRSRMDERPDMSRSIMDGRFIYIRNFLPHLPHGQHIAYQQRTPTSARWLELFKAGQLDAVQARYWQKRVYEELYDLDADPYETENLANLPEYRDRLEQLRGQLKRTMAETYDLGFWPEPMLRDMMTDSGMPFDSLRAELEQTAAVEFLFGLDTVSNVTLERYRSSSPPEKYWLLQRMQKLRVPYDEAKPVLDSAFRDNYLLLQIAAAEIVGKTATNDRDRSAAISFLLEAARDGDMEFIHAVYTYNALANVKDAGVALPAAVQALEINNAHIEEWGRNYLSDLLTYIKKPRHISSRLGPRTR